MTPAVLLVILYLGVASAAVSPDPTLDAEWQEWKTAFEKTYSPDEEGHRRAVWEENKRKIELHNKGKNSFTMDMTAFSDMTDEEFEEMMIKFLNSTSEEEGRLQTEADDDVHEFEDLSENNQIYSWDMYDDTDIDEE